jgi:hypothetical protein
MLEKLGEKVASNPKPSMMWRNDHPAQFACVCIVCA